LCHLPNTRTFLGDESLNEAFIIILKKEGDPGCRRNKRCIVSTLFPVTPIFVGKYNMFIKQMSANLGLKLPSVRPSTRLTVWVKRSQAHTDRKNTSTHVRAAQRHAVSICDMACMVHRCGSIQPREAGADHGAAPVETNMEDRRALKSRPVKKFEETKGINWDKLLRPAPRIQCDFGG
jgi:hypothetical protein